MALINNQGDILGALKELGSSDSIKSLVTSMVTAGLSAGIGEAFPQVLPQAPPGVTLDPARMLQANLVRNLIGVGVRTAVYGPESLGTDVANALIAAAVDTLGTQATMEIGRAVHENGRNSQCYRQGLGGRPGKERSGISGQHIVHGRVRCDSDLSGCAQSHLEAAVAL